MSTPTGERDDARAVLQLQPERRLRFDRFGLVEGAVDVEGLPEQLLALPERGREEQHQRPRLVERRVDAEERGDGGLARLTGAVEKDARLGAA
jgi:hypothetical protein